MVQVAKQWIENYRSEQFVRDKALSITRGMSARNSRTGHSDMRNFDAIAKAIHDFIVREILYVRDQNGVERLQTPDATLKLKSGDCDDMVILGGALLESVGVPTRIKLIGENPGAFSHIYLEYLSNNQWKSFDPTLALYPGFEFPKSKIKANKTVSIDRSTQNLSGFSQRSYGNSGFSDFDQNINSTGKIMESGFVTENNTDQELGFDPFSAIAAGKGVLEVGKKLGIKLPFGGKGKEPNAGSSSFVDALDNYESMPNSVARAIVGDVTNMIANGASDYELATFIATKGGEPNNANGWMSSWKWKMVQDWIDKTRAMQSTKIPQLPGINNESGSSHMLLIGGGGLLLLGVGFLALRGKKSKKEGK